MTTASDPFGKTLLIKAKGGLGNRILSAVCGLIFADLSGRNAVIDWRDGAYAPQGENAYPVLFDAPGGTAAEAFDNWSAPVSPAIWQGSLSATAGDMIEMHDPKRHASARVYRRFCTNIARLDAPEDLAVFWCYLPKFGRIAGHMRRDTRFRKRSEDSVIRDYLTSHFTPNARVRDVVANMRSALSGGPVIGVHVRYTDRKVPVERIEAALQAQLDAMPGASIFLATDNAEIETRFRQRFGTVHVTDKYLPPDGSLLHWPSTQLEKVREAENALIDMHLLSGADHLICSRHSTFSETAILIGQLRGKLTDVDRLSPAIVAKRVLQRHL